MPLEADAKYLALVSHIHWTKIIPREMELVPMSQSQRGGGGVHGKTRAGASMLSFSEWLYVYSRRPEAASSASVWKSKFNSEGRDLSFVEEQKSQGGWPG